MKIKYPKNQFVEMNYDNKYLITRETYGHGVFTLYEIKENGELSKIKTANSPYKFKQIYNKDKE